MDLEDLVEAEPGFLEPDADDRLVVEPRWCKSPPAASFAYFKFVYYNNKKIPKFVYYNKKRDPSSYTTITKKITRSKTLLFYFLLQQQKQHQSQGGVIL